MAKEDIFRPAHELLDEVAQGMLTIDESGWGPWKLNRPGKAVYTDTPYTYELPLAALKPQSLIGTLRHLAGKTWATNDYLGGLARAAFAIEFAAGDPLHKG